MSHPIRIEVINVPVGRGKVEEGTTPQLVICDELWAIRPRGTDDDTNEPVFIITHKPTGYQLMEAVVWDYALQVLLELQRRTDINWAFTDPKAAVLVKEQFREVKAAARKATGGAWLDEPPQTDLPVSEGQESRQSA